MHDPENLVDLPCAGTLLASTMALMTMWAAPCQRCSAEAGVETLRSSLALRIASQLQQLQEHPEVGGGLRNAARQLQARWQGLAASSRLAALESAALPGAVFSSALH